MPGEQLADPHPGEQRPRGSREGFSPRRSPWRALQHPDFRLYFAGSLVSNLGTWLQNTAQIILAFQLTHSVLAIGLVTCAQFSGSLVLGPWAAVVASRVGGKRMLIMTQVMSVVVAASMAWLQASGMLDEHLLIAGALGLGLAFTFALPVQTALVPRLAREADTEGAMTMNSVSYNAGRAVAPAVCVLVIVTMGFAWAFALNAISFMVFAAVLAKVHPRVARKPAQVARARDGLVEALKRPRIMLILAMVAAVTLADDPVLILGPALARHLPGASNDWAGFFLSALGCGTILGSFRPTRNSARLPPSRSSRRAAWSLLILAGAVIVFALGFSKWVSLGAAFIAGVAALRTGAVTQTQLVRAHPEHTASVMALWAIAWAGTKPLASLLDGWLASTLGIKAAAIVLVLVAVVLALCEICLSGRQKNKFKELGKKWGVRLGNRIDAVSQPVRSAA